MKLIITTVDRSVLEEHWDEDKERMHGPHDDAATMYAPDGNSEILHTTSDMDDFVRETDTVIETDTPTEKQYQAFLDWLSGSWKISTAQAIQTKG